MIETVITLIGIFGIGISLAVKLAFFQIRDHLPEHKHDDGFDEPLFAAQGQKQNSLTKNRRHRANTSPLRLRRGLAPPNKCAPPGINNKNH